MYEPNVFIAAVDARKSISYCMDIKPTNEDTNMALEGSKRQHGPESLTSQPVKKKGKFN